MENVELKVNVLNQLALLKNSTFKDKFSFVDENLQNAQRAKATKYIVNTIATGELDCYDVVFENNGAILEDFQMLFSLAETGWDEEIIENENPFGMGFFSNITATPVIEIYSGCRSCVFNVNKMLETQDTKLDVLYSEDNEYIDGFKIVLKDVQFNWREFPLEKLRERVYLLGKYTHDLEVYWIDTLCPKSEIFDVPRDCEFASIVDNSLAKGWIGLKRHSWDSAIKILYHGRIVREITEIQYAYGDLHITDKSLNLTAPDRRDVIIDEKWMTFLDNVTEYVQDLAYSAASSYETRKNYEWAIVANCDVSAIIPNLKFDIIHASQISDYKNFKALRGSDFLNTDSWEEIELMRTKIEEGTISITVQDETRPTWTHSWGTSRSNLDVSAYNTEVGNLTDDMLNKAVWIEESDLVKYEATLKKCAFYDIYVIVAKTEVERRILLANNITHIDGVDNNIIITAEIDVNYNNKKDDRGAMLLDLVSRLAGFDENMFIVGYLEATRVLELNGESHKEVVSPDDPIRAIYSREYNKVLVDRRTLREVRFTNGTNTRITIQDYKYLCTNLPTLCQELSLCGLEVDLGKVLIGLGTRVKSLEEV